ncbi:MAG TPA: hypothetical protein VLB50_13375 [Ignavibacteriaceae bacterium]|nr:hypothetical protein [Ignavibacteriaceae bacterium]
MNKSLHRIYVILYFVIGIGVTLLLAVYGYGYYTTPLEERFFQPQYEMLKPSGILGHGLGILGSLMMIFGVVIYMVRKRIRKFLNIGYLKHWLEFHIFLCTVGPVLVLYHTAFKFGGIVAVSFWSMVAVVASGVAGRFIYVQIPRTIQGKELTAKELIELNDDLTHKLRKEYSINGSIAAKLERHSYTDKYKQVSFGTSFVMMIQDYFGTYSVLRQIKRELKHLGISGEREKEVLRISKSKLVLSRKIGMLRTTQKLFRYWHIVHLPFAIAMFVIMFIHIVVTIVFGYKWIF